MAVDGRKLSVTLRLGSDVFNEHPCTPCAKDNRNAEAIKYCVDCDENICGKCESDHKRFAVMRGHQIENNPRTQAGQNRLDLPTTRCDKHGGKLIDVYCPSHDKVGCSTCVAVDHSTCQGIQYIPNVAKGIGANAKLKDLEIELADLQKQIASLKLQKQSDINQLQQDKDNIMKEITALRKKINDHLDKMQTRILAEVDILFDQRFTHIVTSTKKCEDIESKADKIKKQLKDARNVNDAELFVQLKDGSAYVKENAKILKDLGTVDEMTMTFYTSKEMGRLMSESTSFGHVSFCMRPRSALHVGDFDASLTSDKETCWITGVCLLGNSEIVMADYANKRLKKLSGTFTVTEHIDLPDSPYGVCEVDSQQLAVTLINQKKVQLVTQKVLKLRKSFNVGDRCRDIVYHDSVFYVCCGGEKEVKGEGPGHIEVYSLTGELKRSIVEGLHSPMFVHVLNTRNELIVTDNISVSLHKSRLVFIDLHDHSVQEIKTDALNLPFGFCMIGDDRLCIGGNRSNNLVLVSKDGQIQQELLTQKDGLKAPWVIRFDEKQTRLIITFYKTNAIKVFKLEM